MMKVITSTINNNRYHPEKTLINVFDRITSIERSESTVVIERDVLLDIEIIKQHKTNSKLKHDVKMIFSIRSFLHIKSICEMYLQIVGEPIHKYIEKKFRNNRIVLISIINFSMNPVHYFAELFQKKSSDYRIMIPIVLMRAEVDMALIKAEFEKTNGKSLKDCIRKNASRYYKYGLYELIGETRSDKVLNSNK